MQDEILADGSRIVHKVSRQAPGRVSIISGDEEVLLDEYIEVTEHIVDYLTRFSGLAAGDLSPATAPHRLSPYKVRAAWGLPLSWPILAGVDDVFGAQWVVSALVQCCGGPGGVLQDAESG